MAFHVFKESEVRSAIDKKAPIRVKSGKRSPHKTIFLEIDGVIIDHMKIPNSHSREFTQGKAGNLAGKLKLNSEQYRLFVKCDLKKDAYHKILSEYIKENKKN